MKKVLIAVDGTKGSKAVLATFHNAVQLPAEVVLLHVQRLEGRSLMIDMLGEAELSTLRESLKGTEYKADLDKKAEKVINFYKKELESNGLIRIKTIVREGISSEEILKVAEEEKADLIIMGNSNGGALNRLIAGSVSREVSKNAKVPVLVAKNVPICEEPYTWKDAYYAVSILTAVVIVLSLLGIVLQVKVFQP